MSRFGYEVEIDRPVSEVWRTLSDFGGIYRYNPNVPSSHLTSNGGAVGVGTTRHCDLGGGTSIEERLIEWRDGEGFALEIYDGVKAPPFKSAIATFEVDELGDGRSKLRASIDYRLRFGPLGAALDRVIVARRLGSAFAGLVAGIKRHLETGEEVDGSTNLSAEQAAVRALAALA